MRVMRAIFRVFFFCSIGSGSGRSSIISRPTIALNRPRHLESGDDPGDEYNQDNLAPRVLSLSPRINFKFRFKTA